MTRLLLLSCPLLALAFAAPADEPAKTPTDVPLRSELMKRVKEDQAARNEMINQMRASKAEAGKPLPAEVVKKVEIIDRANTAWLKDVVAKQGWPTISVVGKDGANAAWLLVQHADLDREFQKKCLGLMKDLVPKGEVNKRDYAYLVDRVLVAEGKKQRFGTQFRTVNGKMEPQPIEDEARVDERRKEMGLGTMAEYRQQMEKVYGPAKK